MNPATLLVVYLLATAPAPQSTQGSYLSRLLPLDMPAGDVPVQSLALQSVAGANILARQPAYDAYYVPGRFPAQAFCSRTRFTPGASVPISSYSNDPRTPTTESNLFYLGSGCAFYDVNGDGTVDYNVIIHPRSLRDIGQHEFSCWIDTVPHAGWCVPVINRPPCNYICEASVAVHQTFTVVYNVVNYPPSANPTFTPTVPNWASRVQFNANSNDPDGGNVVHRWSVTSKPVASTASLTNAGTATPSIAFGNEKDIGTWVFRLEVDDDEGETRSYSLQFTVPNVPPIFEISGASQVVVQKNIQLGVTSTTDVDGGNLTFSWDVLQAPAGATPGVVNGYSTQPSISIPTTGKEVGTWRFRVTGRDNEGASVSKEITVTVVNIKPRIQLSGATHVDEGNPIHLETSILDDEDGGSLTFKWEVVQAPQSAGVLVPSVLATSAGVTLPAATSTSFALAGTDAQAVPGTWIFRLTATDDENESVTQEATVLLDGLPKIIFRNPPVRHIIGSGPLVLDVSLSEDPDSPCPTDAGRCHLTDGRFVTVSPGMTGVYEWYASQDLTQHPLERIETLFPGYGTSGPVLNLGSETLPAGEWTFEARGMDGEGNPGTKRIVVSVMPPDTAPEARAVGPAIRPTVLLSGLNLSNIVVDGSLSIDVDNTFDGTMPAPGLGITHYQWTAVPPAPGCPVPMLPSGPQATSILLFPAGAMVPPACQGRWQVTLTVRDDDSAGQQSSNTALVSIGNCASLACLDAPVPGSERILHEDDTAGVLIATHLDSAFYDELAFATGAAIVMDVVYAGTTRVAFEAVTPVLNQVSRGLPLFLFWNGRNSAGALLPGTFDIILSVQTGVGLQIAVAAGPRVIVVEDVKTQVAASSDRYVQREKLTSSTGTASFQVSASGIVGALALDSFTWRIMNASGTTLATGTLPGGNGGSQTVSWDGRGPGGVVPPPGDYTFEAEAARNGVSLGKSEPHLFTLFSLTLDPVVIAPANPGESPDWIHLERNDAAITVTSANFTQRRLRMSPVLLKTEPTLQGGTVTLEQESGQALSVEFFEEGGAYKPVGTLPGQWSEVPSSGLRLLAYGKGLTGDATFKMTYRVNGTIVAEERVRYRLAPPAASVGIENTAHTPHFREVRTVNAGSPIRAALDRTRQRERTGRRADVYLVAHRDAVAWAANPSLTNVSGSAKRLDVGAANADPIILSLWAAALEGAYDVVYDFGNFADAPGDFVGDGRLDPGDLLVSPAGAPAVEVEGSYVAPGPLAFRTFDYGGKYAGAPYTVRLPGMWDGVVPAGFSVPLRGRAVYPVDMSVKRPLVVIAHGNHMPRLIYVPTSSSPSRIEVTVDSDLTSDENFRGYTYLQEHLASQGFITISVDLDSLYGDPRVGYPALPNGSGIQARAWILLKNIELLLANPAVVPDIAGKIEASRIYLAGHSRGGEAVIVAQHQLKNLASSTPIPGSVPPGGTLVGLQASNIRGIISLSPVSSAVERLNILSPTVPYLLIYGSADGDVNGASSFVRPFIHYDRAQADRYALRIEGANHNFFNTSWAYSDASQQPVPMAVRPAGGLEYTLMSLTTPVGATATLLPGGAQRQVATAYISAFLKMVDKDSRAAGEYFLQQPATLAPLGTPAGVSMYSQAQLTTRRRTPLDDFETTPSLNLSSQGQPVAFTVGDVTEELLLDSNLALETEPTNRFFQQTRGVLFSWTTAMAYEQTVPPSGRDLRLARSLNFRVAQAPFHALTSTGGPLSFQVELEDGAGHREVMSLKGFDQIAPVYPAGVWWGQHFKPGGGIDPSVPYVNTTSAAFKTFRLPVAGFAGTAADVDLGNITKVRIRLADSGETAQGRVALDDLEIEF